MTFVYRFDLLTDAQESFVVFDKFPEVLSTVSTGEIESSEIKSIALDALRHAIQARIDFFDEIPAGERDVSSMPADRAIVLPPLTCAKILLYEQVKKRDWTKTQFAREIEITASCPQGRAAPEP